MDNEKKYKQGRNDMNTLLLRRQLLFMMNDRALPYSCRDSEVKLDMDLLEYFKERIETSFQEYIDYYTYTVFKTYDETYGLLYIIHCFNSAQDATSSWSYISETHSWSNFDDFNLNDEEYDIGLGGIEAYVFWDGSPTSSYDDGRFKLSKWSTTQMYFGDGTYQHQQDESHDFYYRDNYPIYCNGPIFTTDDRGVRGPVIIE